MMIEIYPYPLNQDHKLQIGEGFKRQAYELTGETHPKETKTFIANDLGYLAGAISTELFWGALHVKYIYVETDYRNQGLGKRLLDHALDFAKEHSCPFVYVETLEFQALDFFKRMGFSVDFSREGFSNNQSLYYLSKPLMMT